MTNQETPTLYALAANEMTRLIGVYLTLTERTNDLASLSSPDLETVDARRLVLAGLGSALDPSAVTAAEVLSNGMSAP